MRPHLPLYDHRHELRPPPPLPTLPPLPPPPTSPQQSPPWPLSVPRPQNWNPPLFA